LGAALMLGLSLSDGRLSRDELHRAMTAADVTYEQAQQRCASLPGNQYDICQELAYGEHNIALAWLNWRHSGSEADAQRLLEVRAEAAAAIAAERCESSTGLALLQCTDATIAERAEAAPNPPLLLD
jgi:hypothetical protein